MLTLQQPTHGMKTIGIDLDDTLADFSSVALYIMRRVSRTPENVTMENWTEWDITKCFGKECEDALVEAMTYPQLWLSLAPFERVGRVMADLMQKHRVHVVSYRPKRFYDITRSWLVMHEIPFDDLSLVAARSEKLQVAQDHGITAFIDDNQELCESLRDSGIVTGQVARPWNRGGDGILRAPSFRHVSEQVVTRLDEDQKNYPSLF